MLCVTASRAFVFTRSVCVSAGSSSGGRRVTMADAQELENCYWGNQLTLSGIRKLDSEWHAWFRLVARHVFRVSFRETQPLVHMIFALELNHCDLFANGVPPSMPGALKQMGLLSSVTLMDCSLRGEAVRDLLRALAECDRFSTDLVQQTERSKQTMSLVLEGGQAPMSPVQGCKLVLSDNSIASEDFDGLGKLELAGVSHLALDNNALITDACVPSLAKLFPSLRQLFLSKTGIRGAHDKTKPVLGCALIANWPYLESLSVADCSMRRDDFAAFTVCLTNRAEVACEIIRGTKGKKLPKRLMVAGVHPFFHLDLRGDDMEIAANSLSAFFKTMDRIRTSMRTRTPDAEWVTRGTFGKPGCKTRGIVVRHDYEDMVDVHVILRAPNVSELSLQLSDVSALSTAHDVGYWVESGANGLEIGFSRNVKLQLLHHKFGISNVKERDFKVVEFTHADEPIDDEKMETVPIGFWGEKRAVTFTITLSDQANVAKRRKL